MHLRKLLIRLPKVMDTRVSCENVTFMSKVSLLSVHHLLATNFLHPSIETHYEGPLNRVMWSIYSKLIQDSFDMVFQMDKLECKMYCTTFLTSHDHIQDSTEDHVSFWARAASSEMNFFELLEIRQDGICKFITSALHVHCMCIACASQVHCKCMCNVIVF